MPNYLHSAGNGIYEILKSKVYLGQSRDKLSQSGIIGRENRSAMRTCAHISSTIIYAEHSNTKYSS